VVKRNSVEKVLQYISPKVVGRYKKISRREYRYPFFTTFGNATVMFIPLFTTINLTAL
jgi:hypothetical protein